MSASMQSSRIEVSRHRIRGLLGATRARAPKAAWPIKAQTYRVSLIRALLTARRELRPPEYMAFQTWVRDQVHRQVPPKIRTQPIGFHYLGGITDSAPLPLEDEIL